MFAEGAARLAAAGITLALLAACAISPGPPGPPGVPGVPGVSSSRADSRVGELARAIADLGSSVESEEALRAAHSVVVRSDQLVSDYRIVRPPQLHNLLVNFGLRERGLCCHFAEDLIGGLLALELATLDVHWVVSRHGNRLREHSSVVLVPSGQDIEGGLVLDAWRHAGQLVWARVGDDRYPWQLHPMSGDWARLHCR